jgi:hypothetical protein
MGKPKDSPEMVQVEVLIEKIYTTTTLTAGEKDHLKRAIDLVRSPPAVDKQIYLWVVVFLGSTALLTVLGSFLLMLCHPASHPIPTGLIALGSACVGALAGLLAPTPKALDSKEH